MEQYTTLNIVKKKKKKLTKNSSGGIAGQQLSALISGTCCAEGSSGEPRARRPSQAGAGGVGAEGSPHPVPWPGEPPLPARAGLPDVTGLC